MEIKLYNINKRINSTKQPTTAIETVNGILVDDCDILQPTIIFGRPTCGTAFNYLSCNLDSGKTRYFWVVSRTVRQDGRYSVQCVEDFYATWKSSLNSRSFQLVKAPTVGSYDYGSDGDVAIGNKYRYTNASITSPFTGSLDSGCYVVGVNKKSAASSTGVSMTVGSVEYFIVNKAAVQTLLGFLTQVTGALADVNPISNIVSCMWIPITPSFSDNRNTYWTYEYRDGSVTTKGESSDTTDNKYGYTTIHWTHSSVLSNPGYLYKQGDLCTLSTHPSSASFPWVNKAPYVRHTVSFGPFGQIDIPVEELGTAQAKNLKYKLYVDIITGIGKLFIYTTEDVGGVAVQRTLIEKSAQVGVPIAISSITSNSRAAITQATIARESARLSAGLGIAGGIAGLAASAVTGNPIGAAAGLSSIGASIVGNTNAEMTYNNNLYVASLPKTYSNGSNGSFIDYSNADSYYYMFEYLPILQSWPSKYGYLNSSTAKIGELGDGFYKTANADFAATGASLQEIQQINNQLNSGIYYE